MPKQKKRNRRHSNRSVDSSSSSSSSDSNPRLSERELKRRVRSLERQLEWKTSSNRYQGKINSVPTFRANLDGINVEQWLHAIDSTGDLFGWDEKARIFCMSNKLGGNARHWYNNQETINLTWHQWKRKLVNAFPPQARVFMKLKELVNVERERNQNLVDFYYRKLCLGQSCKLADEVIVDIIVNTVNDPFVKSGARAAGCRSTDALLKFLISNVEQPSD